MPKFRWSIVAALTFTALVAKAAWPAPRGAEFTRGARVTRASGIALSPGERCTVAVRNESRGRFACRVQVECGSIPLFGGRIPGGFAQCTARDGRWVRAEDNEVASRDGDPALELDVASRAVVIQTERARVEAELDE